MSEDIGRISVSRDALKAELLGMELRLVDKLATKDEVETLRTDVDKLKTWRAYTAGATAVALGLGTTALSILLAFHHS
jgi:hypothetical protein